MADDDGPPDPGPAHTDDAAPGTRPPRFVFECQRCAECCRRDPILVTLGDLGRWEGTGQTFRVAHRIRLDRATGSPRPVLDHDDDGFCALYHRDRKECTLGEQRPVSCRAYPLAHDGTSFRVQGRDCPGIRPEGTMSREALAAIRDDARTFHAELLATQRTFPVVEALVMREVMERSLEFWKGMDPARRAELEKQLGGLKPPSDG